MSSDDTELVLLIHGTFAGRNEKNDDSPWWREGGDVWNRLQTALPSRIKPAATTEEFRWSGENSQRDRREAGRNLYARLKKLEAQGRKYHLVGHSHGGSVIWNCLLESVRERFKRRRELPEKERALPGLQSWTSIGTPFLQLKALKISGWVGSIAELSAFVLPMALVGFLIWYFWDGFESQMAALRMQSDLMDLAVKSVESDAAIFSTVFGLIFFGGGMLVMGLYFWVSAVRLEAVAVRDEARIRNQAFVEFSDRWLGIWSQHDEAINGLKATLRLGGKIAPRISIAGGSVFAYDRRLRAYRIVTKWLIAPFFNLLISRPSDGMIWRGISRNLQGNDRPGCVVKTVTTSPLEMIESILPPLPKHVDDRLVDASNKQLVRHSKTLIPKLREFLSQAAWSGTSPVGLLAGGGTGQLQENVLVHTSYLHDDEILQLIARHAVESQVKETRRETSGLVTDDSSISGWYRSFRQSITSLLKENEALRLQGLPLLGARNARGWFSLTLSISAVVISIVIEQDSVSFAATPLCATSFAASVVALLVGCSAVNRSRRGARARRISRLSRVASLFALLITGSVLLGNLM